MSDINVIQPLIIGPNQPNVQARINADAGRVVINGKTHNRRGYLIRKRILTKSGILPKFAERRLRNSVSKYEYAIARDKAALALHGGWRFPERMPEMQIKILDPEQQQAVINRQDRVAAPTDMKNKVLADCYNMYDILVDNCAEDVDPDPANNMQGVAIHMDAENAANYINSIIVPGTGQIGKGKISGLNAVSAGKRKEVVDAVCEIFEDSANDIDMGTKLMKSGAKARIAEAVNVALEDAGGPAMVPTVREVHTQASVGCETGVGTDDITKPRRAFRVVKRRDFRSYRNAGAIDADEALTYYLKCKNFMKPRDSGTLHQMVSDARVQMMKNGHTMDCEVDYEMMTRAVMAAFLVDAAELEFRQRLKNHDVFDALTKITEAANGNLGRIDLLGARAGQGSILGRVLPSLDLDTPKV